MLSVGDAPATVRAAVLLLRNADREVRNKINRDTRALLNDLWRPILALNARTSTDHAVIVKGARVAPGNPPSAIAATSKRPLKHKGKAGSFVPADKWYAVEFGGNQQKEETYGRKSPNGGRHTVTRHTARQLPQRRRKGRVAHEAIKEIAPRMVSLWVQLIVKVYNDAAEGKEGS